MRSLQTTRNAAFRAVLLAGGASLAMLAAPALAQDGAVDDDADADILEEPGTVEDTGIVVTGSRILRRDFESNSPIVTIDEGLLENSSTAALEQNLNKLPQFVPAQTPTAGGDIQPTATNTPGAATVSLRGIGTNRNLVLIDGRRATPGNASGVVDINTIPSAAVERVEVITGGASATYGADAIAGVTNFILKKNFQGLELDARAGISERGDGFEFQVSGIMGSDFDDGRGNVSFAMSMNKREASFQRDRPWYRDLYSDPQTGGNQFFIEYPGIAFGNDFGGLPSSAALRQLFPGSNPLPFGIGTGPNDISMLFGIFPPNIYTQPEYNDSPFTWGFLNRFQQGGLVNFEGFEDEPLRYKRTADGGAAANYTDFYLVLPLTRYNMFARGNYEINDWVGVFGQALYSKVSTATRNQGGAFVGGWDVFVPYGTGTYTGSALPINVTTGGRTIDVRGFGNPSSVILNGMPFQGGVYTDPTPGNYADNPTNPGFTTLYGDNFACANNPVGGCTNNQVIGAFIPEPLRLALDSRPNPNAPAQLVYGIPEPRTVFTEVDTYNLTAGLEGSIPESDWTWEAFANFGESVTFARQTGTYSLARARALLQAPGFGLDFINNSNTGSIRQNVVNGIPIGFGANVATCETGFNIFQGWNNISQDCKDALKADLKNRSKVQQNIWEANATGTLFEMPAGPLQAAIGASYRETDYEFINDTLTTQNASFLDQAIGIYPSVDFEAQINVKEVYGELLVPVIRDSFIQSLTLELGGRISDYSTTGTSYTYKALGDLELTDWLRFRGGYNRAERSPNIAELFLTPQQTFAFNAIGDICSQRSNYFISTNPAAPGNTAAQAADVLAVCQAVMNNTGGPGTAAAYYGRPLNQQPGPGGGFSFPTIRGNPNLRPEIADTWTAGVVFRSPFTTPMLSRLRLTVDWFSIKMRNAIGVSPAATIQRCFDPFYNPLVSGAAGSPAQAMAAATSSACAGDITAITYDPAPALGLGRITASYTNEGVAEISGIDAQLDWSADVGPGTVNLNVVGSYYLDYKVKELLNNPLVDYTGTFGTSALGLQTGAFEYRVLTNIGYRLGAASLGLQWQHLPSVEDSSEAVQPTPDTTGNPNSYNLFNLYGNYALTENMMIRFGVDNLFDKAPPLVNFNTNFDNTGATPGLSTLRGGSFNSSFYDTLGRRFFLGANVKF